jgi:hypothetical protein
MVWLRGTVLNGSTTNESVSPNGLAGMMGEVALVGAGSGSGPSTPARNRCPAPFSALLMATVWAKPTPSVGMVIVWTVFCRS